VKVLIYRDKNLVVSLKIVQKIMRVELLNERVIFRNPERNG